jgi:hypothetical protein
MMTTNIYYDIIDPNLIFGSVGRCGGGYNTLWEDWSPEGREARERIMKEYEEGLDKICGHYSKLEYSILKEGFLNPLIVTCGLPRKRSLKHLSPEILLKPKEQWLILEGVTGGSRLWVAQKYGIPVPCIINDRTGNYNRGISITTLEQALSYFKDPNSNITMNSTGISEFYNNKKFSYHLGLEWNEEVIVRQRAPLWISIMNKHGYYVDRLQSFVLEILESSGVIQPEDLKKRHIDSALNNSLSPRDRIQLHNDRIKKLKEELRSKKYPR